MGRDDELSDLGGNINGEGLVAVVVSNMAEMWMPEAVCSP